MRSCFGMVSIDEKTDLEYDEEIPFSSSSATSKMEALDFEMIHLHSGQNWQTHGFQDIYG
ncbi:cation exchanger 2 [Prunus dulcis]|uniref:Cation exchanger 2 n=1 Tax=Prunus dulcis TaxID=3755 RepID=A0A4Y1R6N2_PRUDU|nr:cation exchanger 2 [Prunus dulcis]